MMLPVRPPTALLPDEMYTRPVLPHATVPEVTNIAPELPSSEVPLTSPTPPLEPAVNDEPVYTYALPESTFAVPLLNNMEPLDARMEGPVATENAPLLLAVEEPVESSMSPLFPAVMAFAVRIATLPEVDTPPLPLTMTTEPPTVVANSVSPPEISTEPPAPL